MKRIRLLIAIGITAMSCVFPRAWGSVITSGFMRMNSPDFIADMFEIRSNNVTNLRSVPDTLAINQVHFDPDGHYMYVTGNFNLLTLYGLTGSVVLRTRETVTDVRHLSSGIYLARIDSHDRQSITRKLIKK